METKAPRMLIAGTNSGCGKTTVVCAILQALRNRGYDTASFKCGPDYIDPMFHREVIGLSSMNIDLFFSDREQARSTFAAYSRELNVIEGVMGFYDGMSMSSEAASSYDVARTLDAPAVLVVNARGMALSCAAIVKGFMSLREPNPVKGVILNRVTPMTYTLLKQTVEHECGVKVYGYLPYDESCSLESRHLGLVTAQEISDLKDKLRRMAEQAEKSVDLDGLIELMRDQKPVGYSVPEVKRLADVRVAVARDRAFCFYYQANLDVLTALGARLIPFSPMEDSVLPECDGLILGGGYPELYARELSANKAMLESVRGAVSDGLPTIAECGGFMYLCGDIDGSEMAGVFPDSCRGTGKLSRFGYVTLEAGEDSMLFAPGDTVKAHEFHYWDCEDPGNALSAVKPGGRKWKCAHVGPTLYAGYPHLYLPSSPSAAERFIEKCRERKIKHETHGD